MSDGQFIRHRRPVLEGIVIDEGSFDIDGVAFAVGDAVVFLFFFVGHFGHEKRRRVCTQYLVVDGQSVEGGVIECDGQACHPQTVVQFFAMYFDAEHIVVVGGGIVGKLDAGSGRRILFVGESQPYRVKVEGLTDSGAGSIYRVANLHAEVVAFARFPNNIVAHVCKIDGGILLPASIKDSQ